MSEQSTEHLDAAPPIAPELRAKILSDPNVKKMAESLGVTLDEFVNQIGYYLNNPGVEPAFLVVSDENLRNMGVEPPSEEALLANVKQTVATMEAVEGSGFTAHKKNTVEMPNVGGDSVKADKVDPDLARSVKNARFPSKG